MPDAPTGKRGRFITLEGGEGAGKSTQARLLADTLSREGIDVLVTREPGGTDGAERLRGLLLSGEVAWAPLAEVLLHFAARAEHVAKAILPALEAGRWVVCDRFTDSTMVYQGAGQGADPAIIKALGAMLPVRPDLTVVLDVPVAVSEERLRGRGGPLDRYEQLGPEFFSRIRNGFLAVAGSDPQRCALLAGNRAPGAVHADVLEAVRSRLGVTA